MNPPTTMRDLPQMVAISRLDYTQIDDYFNGEQWNAVCNIH
jgi:hypothetical protein